LQIRREQQPGTSFTIGIGTVFYAPGIQPPAQPERRGNSGHVELGHWNAHYDRIIAGVATETGLARNLAEPSEVLHLRDQPVAIDRAFEMRNKFATLPDDIGHEAAGIERQPLYGGSGSPGEDAGDQDAVAAVVVHRVSQSKLDVFVRYRRWRPYHSLDSFYLILYFFFLPMTGKKKERILVRVEIIKTGRKKKSTKRRKGQICSF
jgi:hypothetical protein